MTMKLKNVAALIFRVVGAFCILLGIGGAIVSLFDSQIGDAVINSAIGFVFGFCLIFCDKKLAGLFCKGLDDDVA
jgi:Na+/H+ antiporter NhaC